MNALAALGLFQDFEAAPGLVAPTADENATALLTKANGVTTGVTVQDALGLVVAQITESGSASSIVGAPPTQSHPFQGLWSGTFTGGASGGTMTMLISYKGKFSLNGQFTGGSAFSASGTISTEGVVVGSGANGLLELDGGHIVGSLTVASTSITPDLVN